MHQGITRRLLPFLSDRLRPARAAWAHSTTESYVYVRAEGSAFYGSLQMTIASLAKALDSGLSATADQAEQEVKRAQGPAALVRAH